MTHSFYFHISYWLNSSHASSPETNPFLVLRGNQVVLEAVFFFHSQNISCLFPRLPDSHFLGFFSQIIITLFLNIFLMQLWYWCTKFKVKARKLFSPLGFSSTLAMHTHIHKLTIIDPTLTPSEIDSFVDELEPPANRMRWFSTASIPSVFIQIKWQELC